MKKITFPLIAFFATFSLVFISCERDSNHGDPNRVDRVLLSRATAALEIDSTLVLTALVLPVSATDRTVSWSSSNPSVATVLDGRITAVSVGTTNIIVTTQDGNRTDSCVLTVILPILPNRCNQNTPGWGASLGAVTFATNQTWTVGTQIWSDAVTATNCQKAMFSGAGLLGSFNADCRSNPGQKGDLFTWCAVVRFADLLCPHPWRVPTDQDFIDLNVALGGTGNSGLDLMLRNRYLNDWGGTYGGSSRPDSTLINQESFALYWSQSESSASFGSYLFFDILGNVSPQSLLPKFNGFSLRCVRDN
jgi:uncharacterized protein (TIGR02145 family)